VGVVPFFLLHLILINTYLGRSLIITTLYMLQFKNNLQVSELRFAQYVLREF
jgi:hypothetical protein